MFAKMKTGTKVLGGFAVTIAILIAFVLSNWLFSSRSKAARLRPARNRPFLP